MRNSLWPPAGAGLMAVLVVASACREGRSSPSPGDNPTIASVDLSPHSDSVEVHRSRPLKVVLRDPQGLVVAPCYLSLAKTLSRRLNPRNARSVMPIVRYAQ